MGINISPPLFKKFLRNKERGVFSAVRTDVNAQKFIFNV